ncbi:hypothetical protein, variant [Exophiala oligosperma]|uniref:Uncharacterized protein n=1 Tax=Exophiala oligosperma TaxID=215243 RepID=A0A0D2DWW3_9EURO|nr:uncharacterized protein PV06_00247 [Exophiala oligosperma]XP_016267774.1 hypothetical protein, variant [Exophiala oligosperma]KIW47557.1 hypothetical protein PV06_00247 [Exophiala oligosperma]KIW47558.1 hypothetical protein, variant [Exophiala oligosperma]
MSPAYQPPSKAYALIQHLLPVVIVLLASANAQGTIDTRRATEEFPTAQLDLPPVDAGHGWSDQIPIRLTVEILGPSSSHVDIFEILVVRAGLHQKDTGIGFFCETTCNNTA